MFQNGWWAPSTNDYGSTGTRPPQNLALAGQLDLQRNQNEQQKDILGQQQGFQGQQAGLDRALQDALQGRQLGFQGTQAGLNRDFQGNQAGLDRQQAKDLQSSALANQITIAGMPIEFAREKMAQILPMVQGAIGSTGGGGSPLGGGQAMMAPGTVYNDQQINQSVNAMKAGNEQKAGTMQRANAANNSAGGFGSNSPLLQALNQQAQLGAMQANTSGERETRMGAAEANAKQGLAATNSNNQARIGFEQNQIQSQGQQLQARSSLIAALAGMI